MFQSFGKIEKIENEKFCREIIFFLFVCFFEKE